MSRCFAFLFVLFALNLAGCGKSSEDPKEKVYDIKGKVTALGADKKSVKLDHEDIPGFMKAMEMNFSVENEKALEDLKPGDLVQGRLRVKGSDYAIIELKKR